MRARSGLQVLGGETMSTWNFRAAPIIAAIIIFLVGCTSAPGSATLTAASKPEKQDITVAAIPASDLAGLYVALDRGLFAQQGLHVTIKKIPSSQAVIAAQVNGQVDISAGSYVPYIAAQAAGARRLRPATPRPPRRQSGRPTNCRPW
jgi:NitT/TauT family transport system substrate-binding protein